MCAVLARKSRGEHRRAPLHPHSADFISFQKQKRALASWLPCQYSRDLALERPFFPEGRTSESRMEDKPLQVELCCTKSRDGTT